MTTSANPYRDFRFPAKLMQHAGLAVSLLQSETVAHEPTGDFSQQH